MKIKIKSLATEAVHIRQEEKKTSGKVRTDLHLHRTMVVRPEARASLLAYAYLRGKSLHAIERCPTVRPPNWVNVKRIAKKFSIVPFNEAHFDAWTEIDMSLKKVA